MALTQDQRALRDLRKTGKELVISLEGLISQLDTTYKLPHGADRDKTIAALTSKIEYAKDCLKHFGLGMDLRHPAKNQSVNPTKKAAQ